MVANGSCTDGSTCSTESGCANSVSKVKVPPDQAWGDVKFSTAELVVGAGAHSYLVWINNYIGKSAEQAADGVAAVHCRWHRDTAASACRLWPWTAVKYAWWQGVPCTFPSKNQLQDS